MTVAELIEELRKLPQHHPIMIDVGLRYNESIHGVRAARGDIKIGPSVVIDTVSDPRNDPEPPEVWRFDGSEP